MAPKVDVVFCVSDRFRMQSTEWCSNCPNRPVVKRPRTFLIASFFRFKKTGRFIWKARKSKRVSWRTRFPKIEELYLEIKLHIRADQVTKF